MKSAVAPSSIYHKLAITFCNYLQLGKVLAVIGTPPRALVAVQARQLDSRVMSRRHPGNTYFNFFVKLIFVMYFEE